jgi:hypothetical protein
MPSSMPSPANITNLFENWLNGVAKTKDKLECDVLQAELHVAFYIQTLRIYILKF